jgi:hypothetical protein
LLDYFFIRPSHMATLMTDIDDRKMDLLVYRTLAYQQ